MDDNFSIYRLAKLKAVSDAIESGEDFFYRKVCRYVSSKFSMGLNKVEIMPIQWVLQHYYEDDMDSADEDQYIEIIDSMLLPAGSEEYEEKLSDWVDDSIEENRKELEKKGYKLVNGKKVKIGKKDEKTGLINEVKEKNNIIIKDYSDIKDDE